MGLKCPSILGGHLRCGEIRWKLGGEVPGQEFLQAVHRVIGDVLQDMAQIKFGIKIVELR